MPHDKNCECSTEEGYGPNCSPNHCPQDRIRCNNTACQILQRHGFEPLEHNGCPDRQEKKKIKNAIDSWGLDASEVLIDIINDDDWQIPKMHRQKLIGIHQKALQGTANQKFKEGMERAMVAVESIETETQEDIDQTFSESGKANKIGFNAGIMECREKLQAEMENLTQPKE